MKLTPKLNTRRELGKKNRKQLKIYDGVCRNLQRAICANGVCTNSVVAQRNNHEKGQLKKENDNLPIGLLLCKSKNNLVADWLRNVL